MLILLNLNVAYSSDYGTTGLIDTPTARMSKDAVFTTTVATQDSDSSIALTYQALPWLETTFRYRDPELGEYDRNFEVKFRLIEETYWAPQFAVGFRDIVGTGRLRSEYIVASKQVGGFDFSLGMGWGDMSSTQDGKNPLTYIDDRFSNRGSNFEKPGEVPLDTFFRGDHIGIFGGVSYQFTNWPLRFMVERNTELSQFDVNTFGATPPDSEFSYGLEWSPTPNLQLTLSHQFEEEWGLRIAMKTDTSRKTPKRLNKLDDAFFESMHEQNHNTWYQNLLHAMESSGVFLLNGGIADDGATAYLRIGNMDYPLWADAVSKATALADLYLPPSVKTIVFTAEENGYTILNMRVIRPSSELQQYEYDPLALYPQLEEYQAPEKTDFETNFVKKKIALDVGLGTQVQLFDPDDPLRYSLGVSLGSVIPLPNEHLIRGAYRFNFYQNFDQSTRPSNSVLPHVRTDIVEYLEDEDRLQALYLEKRGSLRSTVSYRYFGGVLEDMYSGVGGEVLHHNYRSRLGFGASLAWVEQRDYDSDFGSTGYETVTGFLSAYWATPFYNYDVAVHVGRYLAKDVGTTIELHRTFANGWSVGIWSTFTDVSSEDFGEGSFDKGFYFRIPLDGMFRKNTRSSFMARVRPVQRDGGQRLEGFSGTIWYDQQAARFDSLSENKERMKSW
ncbi:YjbH domain-containing protein [Ketobacter nezhaii]|uniref:YjbH domain-containing protein n=1 Tax=Ketobacter sp. MCCC 1A13808 TaxID=2602738 RepID=UPI0018DD24A8|nr:YjbH domain-containing protein [Ketobacter sp. MCCC 1A13808]